MIHGMAIVRNEEHRYLLEFLNLFSSVCDRLVIIDDCSTDNTAQLCKQYANEIYVTSRPVFKESEASLRKRLWEKTIAKAEDNDIIICLDADELFVKSEMKDIKHMFLLLANTSGVVSATFKLYDMWSQTHYRSDELWTAHKRDWEFVIKYKKDKTYEYDKRSLHCSRFPFFSRGIYSTIRTNLKIKHMGWSRESCRLKKYHRYMELDGNGKYGNYAQYKSILDKDVNLVKF